MVGKLNPYNDAKISFPGFQRIHDFTATGSESSTSVTVDGDTDKEYLISVYAFEASANAIYIRLNNDSGATAYGRQHLINAAGTITAARGATSILNLIYEKSVTVINLLTPVGLTKTSFQMTGQWTAGTTVGSTYTYGTVYNSTSNITSIDFLMSAGNFSAGTRITVYARRSQ